MSSDENPVFDGYSEEAQASALHTLNPAALSDEEVQALFWMLKNEAKLRGISTMTRPWSPPKSSGVAQPSFRDPSSAASMAGPPAPRPPDSRPGSRSAVPTYGVPRLEPRGGVGPEQPIWDDCMTYSAEWWRRFRDWHHAEFPDADQGTRDNLDMFVRRAESRG